MNTDIKKLKYKRRSLGLLGPGVAEIFLLSIIDLLSCRRHFSNNFLSQVDSWLIIGKYVNIAFKGIVRISQ